MRGLGHQLAHICVVTVQCVDYFCMLLYFKHKVKT